MLNFPRVWKFLAVCAAMLMHLSCSLGDLPSTAVLKDISVLHPTLRCNAAWSCGSEAISGLVTSRYFYGDNDTQQCVADLQQQVDQLAYCSNGPAKIIEESILTTVAEQEYVMLDAGSRLGARIVAELEEITKAIDSGCEGDSCYAYWQKLGDNFLQLNNLNEFLIENDRLLKFDIGIKALEVSRKICGADHYGAEIWMSWLQNREKIAMEALYAIQKRALISDEAYSCSNQVVRYVANR